MCFSLVTKLQGKIVTLQQKMQHHRNIYKAQYVRKTVADQNYIYDRDKGRYNS